MQGDAPGRDEDGVEVEAAVFAEGEVDLDSELDGHPEGDGAGGGQDAVDGWVPDKGAWSL